MSTPNPIALLVAGDITFAAFKPKLIAWVKEHATPYHLTVASVLGGITVVFFGVIALLIICAVNFNVLGWIE